MKIKTPFLLLLFVLALCLAAYGGKEAKHPVDYTGTEWSCEDAEISFSVSDQGTVENAVAFE